MMVSLVAGLQIPPATGRPSSTNPIDAQNSGMPCTNSRVPSSGSTTHTLLLLRRDISSALSSESHPSPSRNRFWRNITSMARSASVTGSCPILYSVSIAPGVKRAKTPRADSSAASLRTSMSEYLEFIMSLEFMELLCRPQHTRSRHQEQEAQDATQPKHGNARREVRTHQSPRDRANQQGNDQLGVNVPQLEMQQAGDAGQNYGVYNVGPDIHFGRETIEQEQQHHDDAARPDRGHANQEPRDQPDNSHAYKALHRWRAIRDPFLNAPLQQKQDRNDDEQKANRSLDEVVHAVAVHVTDVHEQVHSADGTRNAAHGQRDDHLPAHRASPQMHQAGRNLGKEVEQRVGADGHNRWYAQAEDQHGEQQHAAPHAAQSDQDAHPEANY